MHQAVSAQRTLLEQDKLDELIWIAEWAGHTADGTLSDLPVTPSAEVWDEVSAEPDLCTRLKCPDFDRCFLFRARRRAAEADVVVVNHHLLAADLVGPAGAGQLAGGGGAAPVPAADPGRGSSSRRRRRQSPRHPGYQPAVRRLLARFERNGRGLAPTLSYELQSQSDLLSRASLDLLQQRLLPAIGDARRASEALFLRLLERLDDVPGGQLRLDDSFAADPDLEPRGSASIWTPLWARSGAAGYSGDHRRPPVAGRGDRAPGQLLPGAAGGDAPAGIGVRRAQPRACARSRGTADRALDGAHRPRTALQPLAQCRSIWRRCCGELLFDRLRHRRAHQRNAGGGR